jgi:hypothetical protein
MVAESRLRIDCAAQAAVGDATVARHASLSLARRAPSPAKLHESTIYTFNCHQ